MMDKLRFDMTQPDNDRIVIDVFYTDGGVDQSLGVLYFERAKKVWTEKPVGLNEWACVDAKVEGLYTIDESITPTNMLRHAVGLIKASGL
jgi:hypothetical protein